MSKSEGSKTSADGGASAKGDDARGGLRRKSGLEGKRSTGVHARRDGSSQESDDEPPASSPVPDLGIDWDDEKPESQQPALKTPAPSKPRRSEPHAPASARPGKSKPYAPKSSRPGKTTPDAKKLATPPKAGGKGPSSPEARTAAKTPSAPAAAPGSGRPAVTRKPLPPRPKGVLPPRPGGAKPPSGIPRAKPAKLPPKPPTPKPAAAEDAESLSSDELEEGSIPPSPPDDQPASPPPPSDRGLRLPERSDRTGRTVGCCELFSEIATGGMATIHLGRWLGAGGFSKPVAVKALHPQYAKDPDFVGMFLDEARVVARIRHPNVTPTIDLVHEKGELFIVMEYIQGVTLAYLLAKAKDLDEEVPMPVALKILTGVLHGLHAAHEATDEHGQPMCVIHRDVSPENIMVGEDGYARLIDFGIATALGRHSKTRDGEVKGKLSYLSPEQVMGKELDRRADVFSASIVLWQTLTGHKLFKAENLVEVAHKVMLMPIEPPSSFVPDLPQELEEIVMRGLDRNVDLRWETAEAMAEALEATRLLALQREVGEWVQKIAGPRLERNAAVIKAMEAAPISAASEALERPMSIHPAPKDAIDPQLEQGLRRLRKPSVNLLYSEVLEAQRIVAEAAGRPVPVPATAPTVEPVELVGSARHEEDLEWTGEVEPAEPIDEADWEGIPGSDRPPTAASSHPPPTPTPTSAADTGDAPSSTAPSVETPQKATTALEQLKALPPRTKALGGGIAAFTVILIGLGIGALAGGGDENGDETRTAAPTSTSGATTLVAPTAEAPSTPTAEPTSTTRETDEEDLDAGEPADAGTDADADAAADAAADAGPDAAPSWAGKGRVPTGGWKPPKPTYLPPDL